MTTSPRGDLLARVMGLLVFLLGVGVILGVLWLAFRMYGDPTLGIHLPAGPKASPTAVDIGMGFGRLILKILLLFLGSISGSLIANKGMSMYFTGLHPPAPPAPPAAAPAVPSVPAAPERPSAPAKR